MNSQNTNILPEEENNNSDSIYATEIKSEETKITLYDDLDNNIYNWINHGGFEERGRKL